MKQQNPKNVLVVALDMTYMDELLIGYVKFLLSKFSFIGKVVFYHNIRFDFPEEMDDFLADLPRPLKDILHEKIEKLINSQDLSIDSEIIIEEKDDTAIAVRDLSFRLKSVFAVLFGKKVVHEGSGYLMERLLDDSPRTHILVFPETAYYNLDHILLPTDFSRKSGETAQEIIKLNEYLSSKITCQHVYNVPNIYFPFVPVKNLRSQVEKDSSRDWERYRQRYIPDTNDIAVEFSFDVEKSIPQIIYNYALRHQVKLIAIPGETGFLSNISIQLLKKDLHIPLLFLNR